MTIDEPKYLNCPSEFTKLLERRIKDFDAAAPVVIVMSRLHEQDECGVTNILNGEWGHIKFA